MNVKMLNELTQLWGPSGCEKNVSNYIVRQLQEDCDEMFLDMLGNLFVLKKGYGAEKKKIMCAAHMDEIGFAVQAITDKGFLIVRSVGGVDGKLIQNTRIAFENGIQGIITTNNNMYKEEMKFDSFYVDIGATSKEEVLRYIEVGDKATFVGEYKEMMNHCVMAKAMDDRVGCYVMIETIKSMKAPYHDVYFVFTVQEEFGLIGATVAAERVKPNLGIAVDITGCYDTPGCIQGNMCLGGGTAIKSIDAGIICDTDMVHALKACAVQHDITYQMDVLPAGKTDAAAIKMAHYGCKGAGISLATRNGHGPCSMCSMKDVESSVNLLARFVETDVEIGDITVYK